MSDSWEADIKRLKDEAAGMQAQLAAMSNQVAQASPKNENIITSVKEENEQLRAAIEKAKKNSEALSATLAADQLELKKTKDNLDRALQEAHVAKDENEQLRAGNEKAKKHLAALSETIDLKQEELTKVADLITVGCDFSDIQISFVPAVKQFSIRKKNIVLQDPQVPEEPSWNTDTEIFCCYSDDITYIKGFDNG